MVSAVLDGGAGAVQLRAKRETRAGRERLARELGPLCAARGVALWIDDDIELACAGIAGVAGVHLGREDLEAAPPDLRGRLRAAGVGLGLSTHDEDQLRAALSLDPTYVGFGPVFPTRSKADPEPVVGLGALGRACRASGVPVTAIGGIDIEGAAACRAVGAAAIAVIGALVADRGPMIAQRARALARAFSGT